MPSANCHTSSHVPCAWHLGVRCPPAAERRTCMPSRGPHLPQARPVQQEQHALGPISHVPLQMQPSRVMACRQMAQGFTFLKAFTLKWWALGASRSSGCRKRGPEEVNHVNAGVLGWKQGQRSKNWQDRGKKQNQTTKARIPVGKICLRAKHS